MNVKMEEKFIYYNPTRDYDCSSVAVSKPERYKAIYGDFLLDALKGADMVNIMDRHEKGKSALLLNSLKTISSILLKDGDSAGIYEQGILKRMVQSRDVCLVIRILDKKVVGLKASFGKSQRDLIKNDEIIKLIQVILDVCGDLLDGVTKLYIELGFIYISDVDIAEEYPFVISKVNYRGTGIARLICLNPDQGLYDVDSKYSSVLSCREREKVRYTKDWNKVDGSYNEILSKLVVPFKNWIVSERGLGLLQGNRFILRPTHIRFGFVEEIVNSIPRDMRISTSNSIKSGWVHFHWKKGSSLDTWLVDKDTSLELLRGISMVEFPRSFPNVHSFRWDTTIIEDNKVNWYWSKSSESNAVDVWITSKDILTQ